MNSKQKILIGGIPGVGKSTLAKELSEHLQIPWLSTDQIRMILDIYVSPVQPISIGAGIIESITIWEGTERLIQNPHPWEGLIIEGTAILPHLINTLEKKVTAVFILEKSKDEILEVLLERSKLPWINTKTKEQIATKADYLWELNTFIKNEADKYHLPTIISARTNDYLHKVISLVK